MSLQSFGYKYGAAKSQLVISIRHFKNPSKSARQYDGRSRRLQKEVYKDNEKAIIELAGFIKSKIDEGITDIAIGCEKGKHRSVAVVEIIGRELGLEISHRDVEK